MIHDLKTWPLEFNAVESGAKRFEFRKNDRGFTRGDCLVLKEWSPSAKGYSGHMLRCVVTYIVHGPEFGVPDGYCVMSIELQS